MSNFEEAKVNFHANQKALEKAMDNTEVEETMHDEQEKNDNYFGFVDKSPLLAGRIFKGFQVVSICERLFRFVKHFIAWEIGWNRKIRFT